MRIKRINGLKECIIKSKEKDMMRKGKDKLRLKRRGDCEKRAQYIGGTMESTQLENKLLAHPFSHSCRNTYCISHLEEWVSVCNPEHAQTTTIQGTMMVTLIDLGDRK